MEQELNERLWAFRRAREARWRRTLRETDLLLDLVEQCRLRGWTLVPSKVWAPIVRLVGAIDPKLRDDLGINRHTDHVSEILFAAQERLLAEARERAAPRLAPIVPLFGPQGPGGGSESAGAGEAAGAIPMGRREDGAESRSADGQRGR